MGLDVAGRTRRGVDEPPSRAIRARSPNPSGFELIRMYNRIVGTHLYTTNPGERELSSQIGSKISRYRLR